ncbi:hypothetical protein CHUAL_000926 [Chamberlinius hualienensis]
MRSLQGEVKNVAGGGDMSEVAQSTANKPQHGNEFVQADYNSNCPIQAFNEEIATKTGGGQKTSVETSHMSTTSSNDEESLTTNDVSDYQWFPDYVDGDSINATSMRQSQHRPSIFSSLLNYSSNIHDINYEAISRNIDANLAEIDMEDFRSEDINSILAIPNIYSTTDMGGGDFHSSGSHGEQAASLSASIMAHFDDDYNDDNCVDSKTASVNYQYQQQLSISITSDSTDMSVCKSEQLFSPVKEADSPTGNVRRRVPHANSGGDVEGASAAPHMTTFSIDSLDCDSYDEQELILTCQTNVDNYTIAFEGSLSRDSEDSDYHDEAVVCETSDTESWTNSNHRQPLPHFKLRNSDSVDGSLVQSDFVYTTWTKLRHLSPTGYQKHHKQHQQQRHLRPTSVANSTAATCNKSQSLPNLSRKTNLASSLKISQLNVSTNGSLILGESQRCIPLYDVSTSSINSPSSSSSQSLSLMRLFMQNRASGSSCNSSTGPIGSISHSMSSGTLQHQTDFLSLPTDSNLLSDRLQCFLNTKLTNNNGEFNLQQDMATDPQLSPSNHAAFKRRPVSPLSSPIEEVDESENTTTTSNKCTQNTIKNKNSDDSIEENSANELEMDVIRTCVTGGAFNELTQGTQTSGNNISGNNNSHPNAMIYITNNNVQRGDSGVSLSSACTSYGEHKIERRLSPRHTANKPSNSSVAITMFATRGTQLPVHVCDEAIQTSHKGEWLERIMAKCSNSETQLPSMNKSENDVDKDSKDEVKSESSSRSATIYVCYPNYSLPDLGFLKELKTDEVDAEVKLSPKKANAPKKSSVRPKSCPGLEHLQPNITADLARIRDWDSLNVLLPKEIKDMLKGLRTTEMVDQTLNSSKENKKDTPLYLYQCNPTHEQMKKLNIIPKGILRRAKTDPTSEIKILNILNPSTSKKLFSNNDKQANLSGEKIVNNDQVVNCKCPVSAELTAMLGISMEECDCENISDTTFEQLCSIKAEIDQTDEMKNKKAVSFSSKRGTCPNCEPQTDHANRILIQNNEIKDKDWSLNFETSENIDVPPQDFFLSPTKDSCDLPSEQTFPSQLRIPVPSYGFTAKNDHCGSASWEKKQELVNALDAAVKALNCHFSQARDPHAKFLTGSSLHTPATGYKVLQLLCPALFNILNDGLQPSVYNIFGHMENSVWMVVETLAQAGNCSKQMSDLVVHVNNEQRITDKRMKFNVFACGLLNIRSLATWFSLLGSSQNLLQKYYSPSAFLNVSTSSMKYLFDELLISLQTLSLLPFDLDLSLDLQLSPNQMSDLNLNSAQCQPQQQPHRICLSTSPTKAKPQVSIKQVEDQPNSKHSGSPKLVHRHSCGLLIDEFVNQSQAEDDDDDNGEKKSQRLRRGLSQDSAIGTAKNSSEYIQDKLNNIPGSSSRSSEEHREGWALKDMPKRPWSYAQDAELEFDISSQNSSKETCSSSGGGDNSSTSSGSKEIKQIVTRCRRNNLSPHRVYDERETVVKATENVDGLLVTDTEKGSLDAKIAERRRMNDMCEPKTMLNDKEISSEEVDGVQFKELQKRWEILSGAPTSCAEVDRKKIVNSNSRSKIPRLVMPLPNSPSPKLKQRQPREANAEQLLLPQPAVVVSSSAQNTTGVVVQTPTNRSSSGSNNANKVSTPNLTAKNTQIASPEKSPMKKPNTSASRVQSAIGATRSKRGTTKGASGGLTDDTTI